MTTSPNIYADLLIYSLLSGILLRAVYDLLRISSSRLPDIVRQTLASARRPLKKPKATRCKTETEVRPSKQNPHVTETTEGMLLLKNTDTVSSLIKKLYPTPSKTDTVATAITDVIFSLVAAVTVTLLLFGVNFGEMRWFVLPLTVLGYFLYEATVGFPVKALLNRAVQLVGKLFSATVGATVRMIRRVIFILGLPFDRIKKRINKAKKQPRTKAPKRRSTAKNKEK